MTVLCHSEKQLEKYFYKKIQKYRVMLISLLIKQLKLII